MAKDLQIDVVNLPVIIFKSEGSDEGSLQE